MAGTSPASGAAPAGGTRRPVSTYRLQITEDFDLHTAAERLEYLRDLGVDWVYLSPLLAAEPGSDAQLTFARSYAAAARSERAVGDVEALLDGGLEIDGLAVDQDLRWSLVTSLAASGNAGERIEAELERDRTISGQEHAAAARAARPTAEAKAEAWEVAMVSTETPNETQRSVAMSFQRSGQDDVLAPYVERYLAAADDVWDRLGNKRASTALEAMFPRQLASQELLDRADAWLARTPAPPAAKRYVAEGRADVARALAAQERDARG